MNVQTEAMDAMPVVQDRKDFDEGSGNCLERLVFNHRIWMVLLCVLVTAGLAYQASRLVLNARFERVIPQTHPYIQNYLKYHNEIAGLGNNLRVVVENTEGDIFDPDYLETLKKVNDALFLVPGVDRSWMKSLWMPIVRYKEVTEEGIRAPQVMPDNYNGSAASLAQLRNNIERAGIVGTLVANDYKSSMVLTPLLDKHPTTGEPLDYRAFSHELESKLRSMETKKIKIHIVGFGKLVGDLIDGMAEVMRYFALAAVIAAVVIYGFNRCLRSTLLVLLCSTIAVIWQLGLIHSFGYELDPYSILVPFLVFAIGVSHGAQKMNGIMQDIARGTHRYVAARYTFRRLFLAGLSALIADAVGFAVLMTIDIPVIKELSIAASVGVAMLVVTNLLLLPVLLSYFGVSAKAANRALRDETEGKAHKGLGRMWDFLDRFTERRWAVGAIAVATILTAGGLVVSQRLKIGDLDPGAPELRADSRYNRDSAFVTGHYGLSSDQFAVIVKTSLDGCRLYRNLVEIGRLDQALRQVPGVQKVESLAEATRQMTSSSFEVNPKWLTISRDQTIVDSSVASVMNSNPTLANSECSMTPVIAYLSDHKADTLGRVLETAEKFAAEHSTADVQFLLVAGTSGIDAVTNIVVEAANRSMLLYVYGAVILLCFVTFRSWRAVVVAVLPLMVTSVLCEALMVALNIGVKVATLPVIALGVGIGIDYALYLLSVQLEQQRAGKSLAESYRHAVQFTGKVVGLVGVTLAAGVVTWVWSPIKFQADMGILLTFMFIWNMVGALILIPALSHFLLQTPRREVGEQAQLSTTPANVQSA